MDKNQDKGKIGIILENEIRDGANWFYWIAALSVINTMVTLFGGSWNFIIGLGITQIVDTYSYQYAAGLGSYAGYLAIFIDLVIAGFFAVLGYLSNKKKNWSFILGMILYAADGLLFVVVLDYLSILFHLIALYFIYKGYSANRVYRTGERANNSLVTE